MPQGVSLGHRSMVRLAEDGKFDCARCCFGQEAKNGVRLCSGAACTEHFLLEVGDSGLKFRMVHAAQLRFDRIDLCMERDDLVLGGHVALDVVNIGLDIGDIVGDGSETLFHPSFHRCKSLLHLCGECLECDFLCHV